MTGGTVFVYKEEYLKYHFGPLHPFRPEREKYTFEKLQKLGIVDKCSNFFEPDSATEEDLLLVHSGRYVDFVKRMSEMGTGYLDYGDTPATKGIYEGSCARVGGSLTCAKLVMGRKFAHAFNPGGGLHHAAQDHAAGFCVFNDVAITARFLQREYDLRRIAIIDTDGHHGDGTQETFYREPILTISFHREGIYPGTGYPEEIGEEGGKGYSVNVPLPAGTTDDAYLFAFKEIVPPLLQAYKPEIVIHQFGVDGYFRDPLVGLGLTTNAYQHMAMRMHELTHELCMGRYIILGGGGYSPPDVCRCWTIMFATIDEVPVERFKDLCDEPRPCEGIPQRVKDVVEEVKNLIFPFHGLESRS